ncbi:MAG: hypothetical protein QHH43_02815 [Candidatus Saccharicenans sp.]|jgi:hypothetical protein|nr:hypothetical protein [Candidatus Saccharicenans sp.]MDH7574676.1 hypothetical protein [Candidatus Saccharicenans sp.]
MSLGERIRRYFLEQPKPSAVFQIAPSYFAALKTGPEDELAADDYVYHPISSSLVEAQLLQKNIVQPGLLQELIRKTWRKLRPRGHSVTVILPEMSARAFIFQLESASLAPAEQVRFIEWKLEHHLSHPVDRVRYSYQTFNSGKERRVLVVCIREEVAAEYEAIFSENKLHPGKLTIPSLAVLNLVVRAGAEAGDFLLVDADLDYLSLVAVLDGAPYLYRQKQLWPDNETNRTAVLKETENTVNFLEDKIHRKPSLVYVRSNLEKPVWLTTEMEKLLGLRVEEVMTEQQFLAPLLGGQ